MLSKALSLRGIIVAALILVSFCVGCNYRPLKNQVSPQATEGGQATLPVETEIPTPAPERLLTICMGQEPASLFLYGDTSLAARSILQAIYDGPIDIQDFEAVPVILDSIPSQANGDISFEPVTVAPGAALVDSTGALVNLTEGVSYLPAGCADFSCAATYSGQEAVQTDQQVVRFHLRPGISWSDGTPVRADDSQYSFETAKALYPRARADVIARTDSYLALDETTVEWRATPGYRFSGYAAAFFTPLPRHAWGSISAQDLLSSEISSQIPLGWGAYAIDEWTPGDHITLHRNPAYFRSAEGLPHFEQLVFRFTPDPAQAVAALLAGECDYLDETNQLEDQTTQLSEAKSDGKLKIFQGESTAWEHLDFGISSLNTQLLPFFQAKEARQAVALCIDRQMIADQLFGSQTRIPDTYVSPDHPLANPDAHRYAYDPNAAGGLLDALGWRDEDGNPETPRRAQGVSGIPDGTAFEVPFLTSDQPKNRQVADILTESLAKCGIRLMPAVTPAEQLFTSGAGGLIFGRNFSLAQFGWMGAWQPPCFLYTTAEIPGPYPQYPKGWGGSNPSGYSSSDFDMACLRANSTLPEKPEYQAAHLLAQSIFSEDLPAIPLYMHLKLSAARPDMCEVQLEPSAESALWNLETFDYGEVCSP